MAEGTGTEGSGAAGAGAGAAGGAGAGAAGAAGAGGAGAGAGGAAGTGAGAAGSGAAAGGQAGAGAGGTSAKDPKWFAKRLNAVRDSDARRLAAQLGASFKDYAGMLAHFQKSGKAPPPVPPGGRRAPPPKGQQQPNPEFERLSRENEELRNQVETRQQEEQYDALARGFAKVATEAGLLDEDYGAFLFNREIAKMDETEIEILNDAELLKQWQDNLITNLKQTKPSYFKPAVAAGAGNTAPGGTRPGQPPPGGQAAGGSEQSKHISEMSAEEYNVLARKHGLKPRPVPAR